MKRRDEKKLLELFLDKKSFDSLCQKPYEDIDGNIYATDRTAILFYKPSLIGEDSVKRCEGKYEKRSMPGLAPVSFNCDNIIELAEIERVLELQEDPEYGVIKLGEALFFAREIKRLAKAVKLVGVDEVKITANSRNRASFFVIRNGVGIMISPLYSDGSYCGKIAEITMK